MKDQLQLLCHSSIRIKGEQTIYFDPYHIEEESHDADYIFCTHSHSDHFSPSDISKIIKDTTVLITVQDTKEEALNLVKDDHLIIVKPDQDYQVHNIQFHTTYAYNINKPFHPKSNNWVGYILTLNGMKYYIAGDTDNVKEIQNIHCDIALIPIGGTFTMDYQKAAQLANTIDAKTVIPTHYGSIVGSKEDSLKFKELVKNKEVRILI